MTLPSAIFFWLLCNSGGNGAQRQVISAPWIYMESQLGYSVGEEAEIHCETSFSRNGVSLEPFKKFRIYSEGKDTVTFVIANVSEEDGGMYTSYAVDPNTWFRSEQSDPVELLIKDPDLPKPSISMSPGRVEFLGSNITIQCRARGPVKRFYLHRFGYPYAGLPRMIETDGDVADFLFINVSWDQLGEYVCTYRPPWGFLMSMPSNTVTLQLLDTNLLDTPSISLHPLGGVDLATNVTIRCRSKGREHKTFYLEKAGGQMRWELWPRRTVATFFIIHVNREHGGEYRCRYATRRAMSPASDPVELLIRDPDLPRPNISLCPSSVALLGSNITISCWMEGLNTAFYLHKAGEQKATQSVEPEEGLALFQISSVSLNHAGSYSCSYRTSNLFKASEKSNNMDLLVLDSDIPRPAIFIRPDGLVTLEGQVDIQCEIQDGPAEFFLHQDGNPSLQWPMENSWDVGRLAFSKITWEHQGNYTCSYRLLRRPFFLSAHSDPVELLISDYTQLNIIRFAVGGLVLLLLIYITRADRRFWKEHGNSLPVPHASCPPKPLDSSPTAR